MNNWDRATEGMDVQNWPHKFTKVGPTRQIGEDPNTHDGIFAQPMVCVACSIEYVSGQTARPPDPCPARTAQTERKRLMS